MDQRFRGKRQHDDQGSEIQGIVGKSDLLVQSCPLERGGRGKVQLKMMTRPWERALLARMQGMAVAFFFIWF
jgi:hypothetical protein